MAKLDGIKEIKVIVIQTIVENAIIHGLAKKIELDLKASQTGTDIVIEVIDNEVGIGEARLKQIKGELEYDRNDAQRV